MGINCLIVSTNLVDSPYPVYPLGAAHISGALESAGHNVYHFDLLANDRENSLESHLKNSNYDLIALSIRNLDTTDSAIPITFIHHTTKVMQVIKKYSSAKIVIGGPAFSILPEKIFAILKPDYGVTGEGENILPWLADCIETNDLPANGIIRAVPGIDPWQPVSYNKEITKHYIQFGGMLNVQTKRGCPFSCSYCSYPSLEGKKLRFRDPKAVAEDVERLTTDFDAKYIFFADAVFNDPNDHYLKVSEALIRNGNKTPWCAFFRPSGLTRKNIALMKQAGLSAMEFGTDAASDTTLAGLNKGFTFADVLQSHAAAIAEKVSVAHFIIFGGPGEDKNTLSEGLGNIEQLKHSVAFGFLGIRILPNTKIHEIALKEGLCQDNDLLDPLFYYSPKISRPELDKTIKQSWHGRFDRIYPWVDMEARIKRLHQKGYIGPMWDFLARKG